MDENAIRDLLPEAEWIRDSSLRSAVISIWAEVVTEGGWVNPLDCPKHPVDTPTRPLIDHVRSVARQAKAVADIVADQYGIEIDLDILIAGALLHDVSKFLESEPAGPRSPRAQKSKLGRLYQHGILGAFKAWARGLPPEIVHIIITHTDQSRLAPTTVEGIIVHYVDYCDSDLLLHLAGRPLFVTARRQQGLPASRGSAP